MHRLRWPRAKVDSRPATADGRSAAQPVSASAPAAGSGPGGPLPAAVAARARLSAELLAALLEVEQRPRATLDDLEWTDAVAARLLRRRADRSVA